MVNLCTYVVKISSFFLHPAPHFTKKLRCYANIGSDLFLREATDQGRIFFAKQFKTFFGAEAHVVEQALLVGYQCVFGEDTEKRSNVGISRYNCSCLVLESSSVSVFSSA